MATVHGRNGVIYTRGATYAQDGSVHGVYADGFPEEVVFSAAALTDGDPEYIRVDGDRLHLTFANGEAEYRLVGEPDWLGNRIGVRMFARKEPRDGT